MTVMVGRSPDGAEPVAVTKVVWLPHVSPRAVELLETLCHWSASAAEARDKPREGNTRLRVRPKGQHRTEQRQGCHAQGFEARGHAHCEALTLGSGVARFVFSLCNE